MLNGLKNTFSWLNKTIKLLVTSDEDHFSTERINSNAFLFSGFLISSLSCIFNFLEGFNTFLNIFTIFSSALLGVLYYLSRFRNYSNIWLSACTVLFLLTVSWFMNAGAIGSTSFMYLYTVIVLNIIAERHQQNGLFLLILSNIIVLYILEYYFGGLIVRPYINVTNQYCDIIFVFLLILIGVFFTTRFIKRSYDKEKNRVRERTKELEIANEKRTNVFINLAHETKTPLTLIANYLDDYMKKNEKQADQELMLLRNTIGSLTKDIVNFFDMEKIQKGIAMYDHTKITDFSKLVIDRIALFKSLASKKQIEINSCISEKNYVKADPGALLRIINNVIENAIKYTTEGGTIDVNLEESDGKIYFSVKDNGIGISAALQSKIFEPYFQINSEKSNFQGIGLGLSIVKKIVQELVGDIALQSDPQNEPGTQLTIILPSHAEPGVGYEIPVHNTPSFLEIEKLNVKEKSIDDAKFTIMVIEDNIALLNYIVAKLQKDYNVYFATNGKEAIEKIKSIDELDLILSDVMMDNGDGFYLYHYLSQSKAFNHIPFIFLTAKNEADSRMKGLSLGAIDYISKPFAIDELNKKVRSVLNNLSNQRNAIVTQAYNSIVKNKNRKEVLSESLNPFESNCLKYNITSREKEVIMLMSEGKINKEIAFILSISVDTVKKHIQNAYEKVGVNNKVELLKMVTNQ